MNTELGIVVAVGPDGVGDGTLDLAAAEALRVGTGVELLHVVHALATAIPPRIYEESAIDHAVNKVGREVLTSAAERMRERLGDRATVGTDFLYGPVGRTIGEAGSKGRLIILERRNIGGIERVVTMSVSSRVAAHASVPVLVVPHGWSTGPRGGLPVTIAAKSLADLRCEVPAALEVARGSDRSLLVLHAAWLAEPYRDTVFTGYSLDQWIGDTRREFECALAQVAGSGVDASVDVRWARPVDALIEATRRSSLLILGRREATRPLAAHLGPLTRAVLHHASCPVLVVDRATEEPPSVTPS